jgi:SAM-dependent methyltransferase
MDTRHNMSDPIQSFYDDLADYYHLIFEDWDKSMDRQGQILGALLASHAAPGPLRILDCACGIGTQSIALARLGHRVTGSDVSPREVGRARIEALKRSQHIPFRVSDMRSLHEMAEGEFDVVVALDNAIPHLPADQLPGVASVIRSVLKRNGHFLGSIRDYDRILPGKPTIQQPAFFSDREGRRIVHQVWDWVDDIRYTLHLYITTQEASGWVSRRFVSEYYCILRGELTAILRGAGFSEVRWIMPEQSGFYQPIVLARC